jgi:PAS domain S-box-containing protein
MDKDGILHTGTRHIFEVRNISSDLLEKSLNMRALAYLSSVKADLLRDTIFQIDSSKKQICKERDLLEENVRERTSELEVSIQKLQAVEGELRKANDELERRVKDRTAEVSKLSYAVEQSPSSVVITDAKGNIEYVNLKFTQLTGYTFKESIGNNPRILKSGKTTVKEYKRLWEIITSGEEWRGELYNRKKNGEFFWESTSISPVKDEMGTITNFISIKEDITERKQKEEKLQIYGILFDNVSDLAYICDTEGKILFLNKVFEKLSGCKLEEFIGKSFAPLFDGEDLKRATNLYVRTLKGESPQEEVYFKDTGVLCEYKSLPLRNEEGEIIGVLGTARDVTERKKTDEQIKASLKEKEVLLDEVHHRVKNNLQIISSLLDMSSMKTRNQEAIALFAESRNRVDSMALIHSQLYESERFDRIDMGRHIQQLSGNLLNIYSKEQTITLDIKSANVYLPVTQAVPCALVLNELISNSLKHAYRDGQKGTMSIIMRQANDGTTLLKVQDDGLGIPEDIEIERVKSLGLKLVRNIVYKQLNGEIEVVRNKGTEFIIKFNNFKEEA